MDRLDAKLDAVANGSAAGAAATSTTLGAIRAEVKRIADQVEEVNRHIHVGNGRPSITARIALIEHEVAEVERWRREKERQERESEAERAREARAARTQFIGVVIGGVFSLLVAGASLVKSFVK
jgi:hypothetical protein